MNMLDSIIRKIKGERDLGHVTSSQRGLVDIDRANKDRKGRTNAIHLPSYSISTQTWHYVDTSYGILTIQKR